MTLLQPRMDSKLWAGCSKHFCRLGESLFPELRAEFKIIDPVHFCSVDLSWLVNAADAC